jgi:hypothetical protein
MATAIVENFSRGLDTRRSELTTALGVLTRIENAFINQGAEIEKRKGFIGTNIQPTPASGVSATFGIEALRDSIVIFGGQENNDPNWPPTGFSYQRLYRPATDANALVEATGVIYSRVFNNKAFVIAEMSDGVINCFYDGELVQDINYLGRVLPDQDTRLKFFYSILKAFENVEGYTAALNNATPANATGVIITGQDGKKYSVAASGTGVFEDNELEVQKLSNPVAGIPGTAAIGSFTITDLQIARPTVNKITSITVGGTELLPGAPDAIGCDVSAEETAARVVAAIQSNSGIGYTASNIGGTVIITADETADAENGKDIVVTTVGRVLIGHVSIKLSGNNFTVDSLKADGVELLTTTFTMNSTSGDTIIELVTDVCNNINAGTVLGAAHGFVALPRGDTIKIGKRVVTSVDPSLSSPQQNDDGAATPSPTVRFTLSLSSTDGGDAVSGDSLAIAWDTPQGAEIFQAPQIAGITAEPIKFHVTGGKPPYVFQYFFENDGGLEFVILSPDKTITHIQQTREVYSFNLRRSGGAYFPVDIHFISSNFSPTLKVKVMDSTGVEATSNPIPVKITLASKEAVQRLQSAVV